MDKIGKLLTKSMTVLDATDENRFFEGYLTVEMKDKQGELTIVDELYKVLPIWMDRGAPITDTHSNRVVGKGINFMKTEFTHDGETFPAIKITGKIHKNYELDEDIWMKIKSGEYKGLSFGGATKADRTPKIMKDGDVAYALTDLEHYEVAVCKDPAVPLALITDYNPLAKATIPSEPRGDGKEIIKCDKFGCYVDKVQHTSVDFSNADGDSNHAQATQTIDSGGMGKNAKPVKMPELDSINTLEEVTELDGGIKENKPTLVKNESPAQTGTGGGIRPAPDTNQSNQDDPDKQTAQNTTTITPVNQAVPAILAAVGRGAATVGRAVAEGAGDFAEGAAKETGHEIKEEVEEKIASITILHRVKEELLKKKAEHEKSAYQTEDGNEKLGGQAEPEDAINQVNRE